MSTRGLAEIQIVNKLALPLQSLLIGGQVCLGK